MVRHKREAEEQADLFSVLDAGFERRRSTSQEAEMTGAEALIQQTRERVYNEVREQQIADARTLLLRVGRKRLDEPDTTAMAKINAINTSEILNDLIANVSDVETWDELLKDA